LKILLGIAPETFTNTILLTMIIHAAPVVIAIRVLVAGCTFLVVVGVSLSKG
jgi:hypothetical protein